MTIYFTADTHFGDDRIAQRRAPAIGPAPGHDEALIQRWNDIVGPDDEIWHIGDFAAGASHEECAAIFNRLNGTKRLVRGNHDSNRVLELPWAEIVESVRVTVSDCGTEWRLFLAHYAHRAWPGLWRGTRHLYGHTHGTLPDTRRSCDVGVDAWDYRPVALGAIVARQDMATLVPEELARDGMV